jgi:hypothetical protein
MLPGLREQGLETIALGIVVAFLCLHVGALVHEQRRMEARFLELLRGFDEFTSTLFGADFEVKKEAVTYLIRALDSASLEIRTKAHRQLEQWTGQTLEPDAEVWRHWWEANRATFEPPAGGPPQKGGSGRFT